MRIDQHLMRHAPRTQRVQTAHPGRCRQAVTDGTQLGFVQTGIDQLLDR